MLPNSIQPVQPSPPSHEHLRDDIQPPGTQNSLGGGDAVPSAAIPDGTEQDAVLGWLSAL